MSTPFTPSVVEAIKRHMNDDHAADSLLICRALGRQPEATSAVTTGVDAEGIDFLVTVHGEEVPVRLLWGETLTERAQARTAVVRLYRESCAMLGVEPRGEAPRHA
ncbi:DUF2470 domain-containing protein [Sinosporangium siamense]|uniref:DUF2470 domain-containing protein n=1 Tax=Sinosporangium siamense TaxID=1367973 RepID=A0A919RGM7_9ACTN|nr:DUF2470 domain-containing protein [Sinosporangium siamense]GII93382.1 hypothetical protein Ssi02_36130 [Sinosporangium siamense]